MKDMCFGPVLPNNKRPEDTEEVTAEYKIQLF